jgi:hypothetical protein
MTIDSRRSKMNDGKKVTRLDINQTITVRDFLTSRLTLFPDKLVEYQEHWSDEEVAKVISETMFPCTRHNVANVRDQVFGALRKPKTDSEQVIDSLRQEIEELKKDDEITKALVHEYEGKFSRLEEAFTKQAQEIKRQSNINLKVTEFLRSKYNVRITP